MKPLTGSSLNWNHVYYFSIIAECSSLKEASTILNLSPSTLSEHISKLEKDLDVFLFTRHTRRFELTQEGLRLFFCAKKMFDTGNRFIDLINPKTLATFPIVLGIVPGSSYHLTYYFISKFLCNKNDSYSVNLFHHSELELALKKIEIDFAFTEKRIEGKDVVQYEIKGDPLAFFISSKLSYRSVKECFENLPIAVCTSDRSSVNEVEQFLEFKKLHPRSIITVEFPLLIEKMCLEAACIGLLNLKTFQTNHNLRLLNIPLSENLVEKVFITWLKDAEQTKAVQEMKKELGKWYNSSNIRRH